MNIFESLAPKYWELGISVMPVIGKGHCKNEWQKWCKLLPSQTEMNALVITNKEYNISLCTGPASKIIAIDNDLFEGTFYYEELHNAIPKTPSTKKGKKGLTHFFRVGDERIVSRNFQGVCDMLYDGKHTILPPSVHEETKQPYVWTGEDILHCYDEIPYLTYEQYQSIINKCEEIKTDMKEIEKRFNIKSSGGRNTTLINQAYAAIGKGKKVDEVVKELIKYDSKNHKVPYFSDKKENKNLTPEKFCEELVLRAMKVINKEEKSVLNEQLTSQLEEIQKICNNKKRIKTNFDGQIPMEIFPKEIQDFIQITSKNLCCNEEYLVMPLLVSIACLIGRNPTIRITDTWEEKCVLWGINIGDPGSNKSAPINYIRKLFLDEIDDKIKSDYNQLYAEWKNEYDSVKLTRAELTKKYKQELSRVKHPITEKEFKEKISKLDPLPEKPQRENMLVSAFTIPAFVECSDISPNFTLWMDELSRLFSHFYVEPIAKDYLIEAGDGNGKDSTIRRVAASYSAKHLYTNILGSIQPDKLKYFNEKWANDGFIERFSMVAFPKADKNPEMVEGIKYPDGLITKIKDAFKKIYSTGGKSLEESEFGFESERHIHTFDHDARSEFIKITNRYKSIAKNESIHRVARQYIDKSPKLLARLSFILSMLQWSFYGTASHKVVRKSQVLLAASFIDQFLFRQFFAVSEIFDTSNSSLSDTLLEAIKKSGLKKFSVNSLLQVTDIKGLNSHRDLSVHVNILHECGFIKQIDANNQSKIRYFKLA